MDGLSPNQPEDEGGRSPRRRISARGVALAGAGVAAALGAVWFMRLPLATFVLKQQLSDPGGPAALNVTRLDFGGMALEDIRIGPAAAPDFQAKTLGVDFGFSPGFGIRGVRLEQAVLRVKVDEKGFSAGALDRFFARTRPPASSAPASIPDLVVLIRNTQVLIETPVGVLAASVEAQGAPRRDFTARIDIPSSTSKGPAGEASALNARLNVRSAGERLEATLAGSAKAISWRGGTIGDARVDASLVAPIALSKARVEARALAASGVVAETGIADARADMTIDAGALGPGFVPDTWSGQAHATLGSATGESINARAFGADATIRGQKLKLEGNYRIALGGGGGFGVAVQRPATIDGPFSGDFSQAPVLVSAQGDLSAPQASFEARTRRAISDALPGLGGTPLQPLMTGAQRGLDRALSRFALNAPLSFSWANDQGRFSASGAANLVAANGARITLSPLTGAGPSFGIALPDGAFDGGAAIDIAGAGLPQAKIEVTRLRVGGDDFILRGAAQIDSWRSGDAALRGALALNLSSKGGVGEARLTGPVVLTGPIAGIRLVEAQTPVNLTARWGEGFSAGPDSGACQDVRAAQIEAAGMVFEKAGLLVCPAEGGVFAAANARGDYSGGFHIDSVALAGRMEGAPARPARLSIARIDSRLGGGAAGMRLDTSVTSPALAIDWDATRRLNLRGKTVTANLLTTARSWRVSGALRDVWIEDSTAPARVEAFSGDLIIEPRGDDSVLRVANGAGRVFDWHETKLLQPLALRGVEAQIAGGKATARGDIRLEKPDAALGVFTLTHDLESGSGDARATARALTFSPALQPYQIAPSVGGVVALVEGPLDADIGAHWNGEDFRTDARFDFKNMNMATAALGPVDGVSGVVVFDDFANLTTPPGQRVSVATINPGIEVSDGVLHFQMKKDLNVTLESAIWPFAGGRLSVLPTTFDFNSPVTQFTVSLDEVDVDELISQLNVKDLSATGKVEGRFPLVFEDGRGRIENGRLQAAAGGGTIQYNSNFQQTGVAGLAFDALRSFRYDNLAIDLNGALDGEIVSSIAFSGVNREPVRQDAGPAPIKLVGIPFKFNVTVRAPFKALSRTAANITDARGLLNPEADIDVSVEPEKPPENSGSNRPE